MDCGFGSCVMNVRPKMKNYFSAWERICKEDMKSSVLKAEPIM